MLNKHSKGGINDYLSGTIKSVFSSVATSKCGTNRILFASNAYEVSEKFAEETEILENGSLRYLSYNILESLNEVEPSDCILTDDKAPVELLGISAIDNMIIDEIGYYKDEIKGKSIAELIKELQAGTLL